jgi:hypothetical protein
MSNSLLVTKTFTEDECDIGLSYYNFLEKAYITNTGKWLDNDM